ncbi:imidazole glycerol phosphate synthase subunit HisH [Vulcanimicrobium alpinum]|uniref:Imidazole glycerol phosphate synthase subunit HisH n=1 Tax=Vulcanimicrobium alpinum TaxID=3016050 RepID=A0AAN1XZV8_UNVUL|nr:imidazole glycerol phosphate synthase subunit HisH [Vulcanimicrobium alpinum]BDE07911.1 imidazole glycerol phosphate synthase subunit HisH [Vulcanimicrobium alpinum]
MTNAQIAVIDYGGGNIGSLLAALERRSVDLVLTGDPAVVAAAPAAILPGDGAFGATMDALRERGIDRAVREVVAAGRPFLGICVGMQVLFDSSDEYGGAAGLGILPGDVRRFTNAPRIPHMGWNDLTIERTHPFVDGVRSGSWAYFLHSYRVTASDALVASCTYGERFAAIVARGNVMATQFHPEKSRAAGARLLDNFLALCDARSREALT